MIITIGRQIGSKGHLIGRKLAQQLEYDFYDKNLITIAAKESGLCPEAFAKVDEKNDKPYSFFSAQFFHYIAQGNAFVDSPISPEKLHQIQSEIIEKVSENNACVIMGRCADYVLRKRKNCLNIFISADIDERIKCISERLEISEKEAESTISKRDKMRAHYYNFYTNKNWGEASNYDICLNSSILGVDGTLNIIKNVISSM